METVKKVGITALIAIAATALAFRYIGPLRVAARVGTK